MIYPAKAIDGWPEEYTPPGPRGDFDSARMYALKTQVKLGDIAVPNRYKKRHKTPTKLGKADKYGIRKVIS